MSMLAVLSAALLKGCVQEPADQEFADEWKGTTPPEWETRHAAREIAQIPDRYHFLFAPGVDPTKVQEIRDSFPFTEIQLERTGCFGTCPSYIVTLRADGQATYNGREYAPRSGDHTGEISLWDYGRLCLAIEQSAVLDGPQRFAGQWTDSATVYLRVRLRESGETIEIEDYAQQGPTELWLLQTAIDGVSSEIEWTPAAP
jgi:hypothetical protein